MIFTRLVAGVRDSDVSEVMERQERTHANMEASDCVDTKQVSTLILITCRFFRVFTLALLVLPCYLPNLHWNAATGYGSMQICNDSMV